MAPLKCCVGGCNATSDTHRLFVVPKNDNLRSLWLSFLVPTNSRLIGLSKDQLLRKRVCHQHFDRQQLDGQGRRTYLSYPCLFSASEIAHGVPLSFENYSVFLEHNYHQKILENQDENDDSMSIEEVTGNEHAYALCSSPQVQLAFYNHAYNNYEDNTHVCSKESKQIRALNNTTRTKQD